MQSKVSRVRFGVFDLDMETGDLRRDGRLLALQPKATRLLTLLVGRAGELVTHDEIHRHLWGDAIVDFDQGENNAIREIRDVLGDSVSSPMFVEEVPWRGFRFVAPLSSGGSKSSRSSLIAVWIGAGLAIGAFVAASLSVMWMFQKPSTERVTTATSTMIVVLPFHSEESAIDDFAYVNHTMTTELIDALGRLAPERLAVINRDSTMQFRDSELAPVAIASSLGAEYFVVGHTARDDDSWSVRCELVRTRDGEVIWATSVDESTGDAALLTLSVRSRLLDAVASKVLGVSPNLASSVVPGDPAAREAYLKGSYLQSNHRHEEAIRFFREAIEIDPGFVRARVALASSMMARPEARNEIGAIKRILLDAIEIDDSVAESHVHLGNVSLYHDWNWPAAREAFERALALSPRSSEAYLSYASFCSALGRHEEAIRHALEARRIDPVSSKVQGDLGLVYYWAGRYEEAAKEFGQLLDVEPDNLSAQVSLIDTLLLMGDESARDRIVSLLRAYRVEVSDLEHLDVPHLERRYLSWLRSRVETGIREGHSGAMAMAAFYAREGEANEAIEWLRAAYEERAPAIVFLGVDPHFDDLRERAEVQEILENIGLRIVY